MYEKGPIAACLPDHNPMFKICKNLHSKYTKKPIWIPDGFAMSEVNYEKLLYQIIICSIIVWCHPTILVDPVYSSNRSTNYNYKYRNPNYRIH